MAIMGTVVTTWMVMAVNSAMESAVKICVKIVGRLHGDRTSFLHRILRVNNDVLSSRSFHAHFTTLFAALFTTLFTSVSTWILTIPISMSPQLALQWELSGVTSFGSKYLHPGWSAFHNVFLGACLCILYIVS